MLTPHHQQKTALGSPVDLTIVSDADHTTINDVFRQLWLQIFEFERKFSRFLPASELSQFNRSAGLKTPVSQEFHDILEVSRGMSKHTNELYNPFILPALQSAGYIQSMVAAHSNDDVDDFSNRTVAAPDKLQLGKEWAAIPRGTALDLGGIGKGYLGDQLAQFVAPLSDIKGYWFSLGGDTIASGHDQNSQPWNIQIEDTGTTSFSIAGTTASSGYKRHAVATSSSLRRSGKTHGKTWHHIIDPRTGKPSLSNVVTASVHADSLCTADILASCAVILGSQAATSFCLERGATGVLLQTKSGKKVFAGDIDPV